MQTNLKSEALSGGPVQELSLGVQLERGFYGVLDGRLVSLGEPEHGEGAVTHELIDVSAMSNDHTLAQLLHRLPELVRLLRIDELVQHGVVAQVAE
jgi:hypothetical protein